jgi:TPR repeat protein
MQIEQAGTASPAEMKQVFDLTKRASELGSSKATLHLGWMYHEGDGVKRDLVLASKYFHRASEEGNPSALLALASIYEKGDGVKQNLQEAEKYLKLAVRVDLMRALAAYGNFLCYERGDEQSQKLAFNFIEHGANVSQVDELAKLALLYEHGEGTKKDLAKAAALHEKAREQLKVVKASSATDYFARAGAWQDANEFELAIKDYSKAIRLKPNSRAAYLARGLAYQAVGDNVSACNDMEAAIKLDPDCASAYLVKAFSELGLGKYAFALKDVNSVISLSHAPDSGRIYAEMIGALASRALHDESGADKLLDDAISNSEANVWPNPILLFLRHRINAAEFAKYARGFSRSTEVHFYTGMEQLISGRDLDAMHHFEWIEENGDRAFYEYPAAIGQLERLRKTAGK